MTSLRSLIALVRRWILQETTAERLARDKDFVERKFTLAQERASSIYTAGSVEVQKIAHVELEAIRALIASATKRASNLASTNALAPDKQPTATSIATHLGDTPTT